MTLVVKRVHDIVDLGDFVLRDEDEAECAAGGLVGTDAVRLGIEHSLASWGMWSEEEELLCVWGVSPLTVLGDKAQLWMLSTTELPKYKLGFARVSKQIFAELMAVYPNSMIAVHTKYTRAMRWTKWLGFQPVKEVGEFTLMRTGDA